MGQKNNEQVRIRNRRYKIKRFLVQPRKIDVKQNGRVVRRIVVRRKTIYPSARRRRDINCLKLNIYVRSLFQLSKHLINQSLLPS